MEDLLARKNVGLLQVGQLVTLHGEQSLPGEFRIVGFPSRRLAKVVPVDPDAVDGIAHVTVSLLCLRRSGDPA